MAEINEFQFYTDPELTDWDAWRQTLDTVADAILTNNNTKRAEYEWAKDHPAYQDAMSVRDRILQTIGLMENIPRVNQANYKMNMDPNLSTEAKTKKGGKE